MGDQQPPRVLLLEDDRDAADLIVEAVTDHFGASNIVVCNSIAETHVHDLSEFDLALSDCHLPDGSGLDALRILLERRDDLPVVIVTGECDVDLAVEAIRKGAVDYLVKFSGYFQVIPIIIEKNMEGTRIRRDNMRLQVALSRSLAELKTKNRDLEKVAAQLEVLASTDLLTGLANRRRLEERLGEMFSEAVRYQADLSCLMVDLDGFKDVNDGVGHQAGDDVLRVVGSLIRSHIRVSDIGARYGGDEFAVILSHTPPETAIATARRLLKGFDAELRERFGADVGCGMSIGVSGLGLSNPLNAEQLIAHADDALYRAKSAGKGRVMICAEGGDTILEAETYLAA